MIFFANFFVFEFIAAAGTVRHPGTGRQAPSIYFGSLSVRSQVEFLARFSYARLAFLLLAAIKLMPLPDEPENRSSPSFGNVAVGPDPWSQRPPLEGGILYAA
jgi:hypothetical protein